MSIVRLKPIDDQPSYQAVAFIPGFGYVAHAKIIVDKTFGTVQFLDNNEQPIVSLHSGMVWLAARNSVTEMVSDADILDEQLSVAQQNLFAHQRLTKFQQDIEGMQNG